jgi:hypothetical protein
MLTIRRGNWRWGKNPKLTEKQKKAKKYFANGGVWAKKPVKQMQSTNVGKVTIRRHHTEKSD